MSEVKLHSCRVAMLCPGTIPHEDILKYTGIELPQRIIDNRYPAPPISLQLNFVINGVSEGRAVFHGMPNDKGEASATAEFKVNLTRPITPVTGDVVCEFKVVHKGLAVSAAALKDACGKLLAFGTETCSIFPAANLAVR
ncbi:PaaI family thioesterase [Mesorhizobium sp.]|uniref:PaaI family thioesterase n=1 Tax=Mesorhizobium sp. TaxID=1871066 RepID=UPI003BAD0964